LKELPLLEAAVDESDDESLEVESLESEAVAVLFAAE